MKIEDIKELLVMFKEAEITGLELETEDFYINFKNEANFVTTTDFKPQIIESKQVADKELPKSEESSGTFVKSPLVGTFYSSSSPEAEPFVTVGKTVAKGDVLCIVEAMKVMNEITAPVSGIIKEIFVENEAGVAFEQSLFIIE